MTAPRILVFSGSIRTGSLNGKLAAVAAEAIAAAGGAVTRLSLADHPLPIYDGDLEASDGPPAEATVLKRIFCAHQGVFIASPEYNASVTPLLKNTLDWISRVREGDEPPLAAYRNRVFAVGSASPGGYGGFRSLITLRQVLELGTGALVIPEQVAVGAAHQAFDASGALTDARSRGMLDALAKRLVEMARTFA